MATNVHTPSISRILSNAGVRKVASTTSYSTGFECIGLGPVVQIHYTPRQIDDQAAELERIAKILNERPKYTAKVIDGIVEVRLADEKTDEQIKEERMEKAAEESPYGVTKAEVNKVLAGPCYAYTEQAAGYVIERETGGNDRLVRVYYRDHAYTSYAMVVGGREAYFRDAVKMYADKLRAAGFSVKVEGDYDYVLVGQPGEFVSEDDPTEVKESLSELREAVEAADLAFLTRKAGPASLFVYYLVPFKDKVRRLEVFRRNGSYAAYGRFGGSRSEFHSVDLTLRFIRSELVD